MDRVEVFNEFRPLLFHIAYRMLGTVMEAEDMVQETFLRWQGRPESEVETPKSYLTTIVTRLCIDYLRSARVQREEYIGPWLPEPLVTGPADDPQEMLMLSESLSMAFLVLLESLAPVERAVYLLREVFNYDYPTIASIVGKSEANCRQMVSRSKRYIAGRRPRFDVSNEQASEIVEQFLTAAAGGDMVALMATLAEDVTWTSDGGGMIGVARKRIRNAEKVARFVRNLFRRAPEGTLSQPTIINGGPGFIVYVDGRPFAAMSLEMFGGRIQAIRAVVNPDKLRALPLLS